MTRLSRILPCLWILPVFCCACRLAPVPPDPPEVDRAVRFGDDFSYFDYLKTKPRASTADGARLTLLLLGDPAWCKDRDVLKERLLARGAVRKDWEISEYAPLTRGKLAFMMCRAARIRTSIVMQLAPPWERYALREAAYHRLMPLSSTEHYVSGKELLDVVARTEEWMKKYGRISVPPSGPAGGTGRGERTVEP